MIYNKEYIANIGDRVMYIGNTDKVMPYTKMLMNVNLVMYKLYTIKKIDSYALILKRIVPCYLFYEVEFWYPYIGFLDIKNRYSLR
jgi:hypothetical protein